MSNFRRTGGFMQMTPLVKNLIIINVAIFLVDYLIFPQLNSYLAVYYPSNPDFKPYQLVTHMFAHAGFAHIFFNMFALWNFGCIVEQMLGIKRFFLLYFISGFGAIAAHLLINGLMIYHHIGTFNLQPDAFINTEGLKLLSTNPDANWLPYVSNVFLQNQYISVMLGASGAINGIVAAFAYLFPNTELILLFFPVPIKAKYAIPGILILYDLGYGSFANTGVAHYAHIGGAITGFLLVYFWNKTNKSTFY
ncbi:MAG TPA: rhomboid family intramembrane serine protease [Chitinophagales bacterium]|nr:rhomboid family intramembrane serine protease [Chitinophagales bacterium]